jgi:hypothetical protein
MAGATECAACPWTLAGRTGNKSPFHFLGEKFVSTVNTVPAAVQSPQVTAPVTAADYGFIPDGWHFDKTGHVLRDGLTDEDGKDHPPAVVIPYSVRLVNVTMEPEGLQFETWTDQRGWRAVAILGSEMSDQRSLARVLGGQGMPMRPNYAKRAVELMPTWTESLRARNQGSITTNGSGWEYENGTPAAFSYGKVRSNCAGDRPAIISDAVTQAYYTPCGSLDVWRQAANMVIEQKVPALQAIIAAAFGAVFMDFTGENGLLMCFRSTESGRYKSSAMKVGCSVFGHPTLSMGGLKDTINHIVQKFATMKHIGSFWDEMNTNDPKTLGETLTTLSQGRPKGRLTRSSSAMPMQEFSTLLIGTANKSARAAVAKYMAESDAMLYRMLEFDVDATNVQRNEDAQIILSKLTHNYGNAGVALRDWCGKNGPYAQQQIQALQKQLQIKLDMKPAERFWVAGITCVLFGATIANELKLVTFDIPAIWEFLKDGFARNRAYVEGSDTGMSKSNNVIDQIAGFCNDKNHFLMRTDSVPVAAGNPAATPSNWHEWKPPLQVCGQLAKHPNVLRLSVRTMYDWCRRQDPPLQAEVLLSEMVRQLGAKKMRVRLGAGTPHKRAPDWVVELDMTRPDLQDLFD